MCPQKCPFHIRAVKCYYQSTWMSLLNSQSRGPISRADGTFFFNNLKKNLVQKRPQNVIAMYGGKGLFAFQTLRLATLGKWATTHERVFFLGKNCCSWTLLLGSIWFQMPITWLPYISFLGSFRAHFDSLKRVDYFSTGLSRRYDTSQQEKMLSTTRQAYKAL